MKFNFKKILKMSIQKSVKWEYVCVLDFEATCDDKVRYYDNEIIEFPSVLLKWDTKEEKYVNVSEIQLYCKPLDVLTLKPFCTKLTGITQETVDTGMNFPQAMLRHYSWLLTECNQDLDSVVIVTCGAWDLNTVFPRETRRWNIPNPQPIYKRFVNLKTEFAKLYGFKRQRGMAEMLEHLKISLDGRHHSGIDDCKNIAKILQHMTSNKKYDFSKAKVVQKVDADYHIRTNKKKYIRYRELIAKRSESSHK